MATRKYIQINDDGSVEESTETFIQDEQQLDVPQQVQQVDMKVKKIETDSDILNNKIVKSQLTERAFVVGVRNDISFIDNDGFIYAFYKFNGDYRKFISPYLFKPEYLNNPSLSADQVANLNLNYTIDELSARIEHEIEYEKELNQA